MVHRSFFWSNGFVAKVASSILNLLLPPSTSPKEFGFTTLFVNVGFISNEQELSFPLGPPTTD